MFILQFNSFIQLESEFTQRHLLKFLCKFDYFPRRYRRKQAWVFLIEILRKNKILWKSKVLSIAQCTYTVQLICPYN